MKWRKLGHIFDPKPHGFFGDYSAFAQSPQALVFDDFVRIYFSTREPDADGTFKSHIRYVDMTPSFEVIAVSHDPVIPLGKLGTFDEHGIFPFHVTRTDAGLYGYTSGWSRRESVSVETGIGLSISHDDGHTFERIGDGPVLSASVDEPFLVGDPFVFTKDKQYMYYIYGTTWKTGPDGVAERTYKIALATSEDGRTFTRYGRIVDDVIPDESQALPTVFEAGGRYHMVFCFRDTFGFRDDPTRGYRLGYAYSDDLMQWTRDDASLGFERSDSGWDSAMECYPHVFEMNGRQYLLYNGNAFGRDGFGVAVLEDV
ncbi:hypothetical protein [Exiguobacterium sp. SH0S2]|uniref:hypothetical protein n=1 Tax=Exiguobacterium sp. SH0S2 TaxID=2510950 RepID=UPI00103F2A1D|nr:hypothetical protein [Exiguobacterium sp. SH0S2]TCI63130.1 hypothetical protein EVJ21_06345 [Exiguobacterium sp. SH0S2]